MQRIYHSMVGIVSAIFGISMIALAIRFWNESSTPLRVLLILLCLFVPLVQPLGVYVRCLKQVKAIPKDLELKFTNKEIYVSASGKTETLLWKKIRYVLKERNMIILITNAGTGYMLTNQVLGSKRDEFYQFAASCISK